MKHKIRFSDRSEENGQAYELKKYKAMKNSQRSLEQSYLDHYDEYDFYENEDQE